MATQNKIENPALDFIKDICSDQELIATAQSIPEPFVQQVRDGYTAFFVNTDLTSDAAFNRSGTGTNNFLRIELRDCTVQGEDEVSFKLKLSGIMNSKNGSLVNMKPGGTMSEGEGWIKGFISNRVAISQEDVEDGLLTQNDFDLLKKYAAWWEGIVTTEGSSAPYKKYSKNRLWLAASNAEFIFTFLMETRNNPTPKEDDLPVVIGMRDMSWSNAHFTNTTPSIGIGRIGKAGGVARASDVTLPAISRSFAPKVLPEDDEAATTTAPTAPVAGAPNPFEI